jgi:hypothetical protein
LQLFVIEGDFIHLREGAQQIISATTAAAKIAAATASSAPYSSLLPSVAVTPVAQSTRQKRGPAVDSRSSNAIPSGNGFTDQLNIIQGVSDVTISGKVRNTQDNGFLDEVRTGQPSMLTAAANGARQDKGANNIRHGYGGKQQGRYVSIPRDVKVDTCFYDADAVQIFYIPGQLGQHTFPEDEVAFTGYMNHILLMAFYTCMMFAL